MSIFFFFFFNDTATTEIYTLSLHDALPICCTAMPPPSAAMRSIDRSEIVSAWSKNQFRRSEEHTSELQSLAYLVCRLLLEKKKKKKIYYVVNVILNIRRTQDEQYQFNQE